MYLLHFWYVEKAFTSTFSSSPLWHGQLVWFEKIPKQLKSLRTSVPISVEETVFKHPFIFTSSKYCVLHQYEILKTLLKMKGRTLQQESLVTRQPAHMISISPVTSLLNTFLTFFSTNWRPGVNILRKNGNQRVGGGFEKKVTFFEKFCNWANMLDDYNWQKGAFHGQNWQKKWKYYSWKV